MQLTRGQLAAFPALVCSRSRRSLTKRLVKLKLSSQERTSWNPRISGVRSFLDFESIVEEVRRFVARMLPADSTTGPAWCLWSFSALGDKRAEILPVERPRALAVGGRCMMRLPRILMFPCFSSYILSRSSINYSNELNGIEL